MDFIKFLIEKVQPTDKLYEQCLEEAIKSHHNEITDYIITNLVELDSNKKAQIFSFAFKYQNYSIMKNPYINDINHIEDEIFYNSCKFDYEPIIMNCLIELQFLNIDEGISLIKEGSSISSKFLHPEKTFFPIDLQEEGILIC